MNKIIDYRIVNGSKNRPLAEHVQYQLEKGFQPYFAPHIDKNGVEKQAMVKYEEVESKSKKKGKAKDED